MDKERLVRLLQQRGEIVAVTGDGTNDAPALSRAHVGLSMGDGTAVAKEASDITILDSSFASIVRAVLWGRSLYLNIQRFILFQMTINVVACLTVLLGAFVGRESLPTAQSPPHAGASTEVLHGDHHPRTRATDPRRRSCLRRGTLRPPLLPTEL